ncbi:MAG: AAA family ATPase [Candidatus Omnitrophica bacterium]|nr:AAA family ATPase [Candidatus Omnitrophota bacterium]
MYLKKLELVGFKSFLNKTTLNFEPGITAIVGPNGSGKSNLYDSIRWVLGEQSAKSLRGCDMQDVIFNGSDTKEPLSMAEVSLTFDNHSKFFNVDSDEVVITRRLFRSGESEYLLNKSPVRLKDITDLFLGTGIGAESYSLVAQGKIDLILSSRPEDRRLVFDEAAGITKYKSQKKEAMRKLEETQQNLLRVNDIISEVKRQISSLERQANKAHRYKEIFAELKTKEVNLALLQKNKLLMQKDQIIKQLADLEAEEKKLVQVVQDEETIFSSRAKELKILQDKIINIRNEILNLENLISRNSERISFNQKRLEELELEKSNLKKEIENRQNKLLLDEEKLERFQVEYRSIEKEIETRQATLREKEGQLNAIVSAIKVSLENINNAKREILNLAAEISRLKNEINDLTAKQQVSLARKRRLDLEKLKVNEEKTIVAQELQNINQEVEELNKIICQLKEKLSYARNELTEEIEQLEGINCQIENLEKEKLTLESHKEFIERLTAKYANISESLDAIVYLNNLPQEQVNGLLIKVKDIVSLSKEDQRNFSGAKVKVSGEAKPLDLDLQRINEKLIRIQKNLDSLRMDLITREKRKEELNKIICGLEEELHLQDINLANKNTLKANIQEKFNRINEEYEIITLELGDVEKELSEIKQKIELLKNQQQDRESRQKLAEGLIVQEEENINLHAQKKEQILLDLTRNRTELEALNRRLVREAETQKVLIESYTREKENLNRLKKQVEEIEDKHKIYLTEISDFEKESQNAKGDREAKRHLLSKMENEYEDLSCGIGDVNKKLEIARKELDVIKGKLHELQMYNKEIDFKFLSIKERILEVYKVDLESQEGKVEGYEEAFIQEIESLKQKLASLGTVNLVAIEEYDDLKSRYDFLIQQQNDLNAAKASLHEAILKINRTTKKMFLETFQAVGEEFRNYFRLLFGGGDARLFLIDEQDPLESGIEIICRPPGKKLQNVLLLSGGEKSLSAIALIFAIFKVRPSPFCVLDEIDAALDEANVDRFGRLLQEFAKQSQFIVITHNKRTIATADVMYGITMEESGVSRIVSVKFAQDKIKENQPEVAVEPVP